MRACSGNMFDCELMLICVPAVPESEKYRAPASVIQAIRKQAEASMRQYLGFGRRQACARKA